MFTRTTKTIAIIALTTFCLTQTGFAAPALNLSKANGSEPYKAQNLRKEQPEPVRTNTSGEGEHPFVREMKIAFAGAGGQLMPVLAAAHGTSKRQDELINPADVADPELLSLHVEDTCARYGTTPIIYDEVIGCINPLNLKSPITVRRVVDMLIGKYGPKLQSEFFPNKPIPFNSSPVEGAVRMYLAEKRLLLEERAGRVKSAAKPAVAASSGRSASEDASTDKYLQELVGKLSDPNVIERRRAVKTFLKQSVRDVDFPPIALTALAKRLMDYDLKVRYDAAWVLENYANYTNISIPSNVDLLFREVETRPLTGDEVDAIEQIFVSGSAAKPTAASSGRSEAEGAPDAEDYTREFIPVREAAEKIIAIRPAVLEICGLGDARSVIRNFDTETVASIEKEIIAVMEFDDGLGIGSVIFRHSLSKNAILVALFYRTDAAGTASAGRSALEAGAAGKIQNLLTELQKRQTGHLIAENRMEREKSSVDPERHRLNLAACSSTRKRVNRAQEALETAITKLMPRLTPVAATRRVLIAGQTNITPDLKEYLMQTFNFSEWDEAIRKGIYIDTTRIILSDEDAEALLGEEEDKYHLIIRRTEAGLYELIYKFEDTALQIKPLGTTLYEIKPNLKYETAVYLEQCV